MTFRGYLIEKSDGGQTVRLDRIEDDALMEGDVTVRVEYSTVNYKDALAMTGSAPIVRRWPMIPGIDFAGVVSSSESADYAEGDRVVATGWGLGESHLGGYAERARVPARWLVALPTGMTTRQAMVIGTAGFTAMLGVLALRRHGIEPGDGDVLVTGAAGGVGSMSVALLGRLGYRVVAATGRTGEADYLTGLGAAEIIDRAELAGEPKPLAKARWRAAVDVAGGVTLANVLSQIRRGGAVAVCGLADDMKLPATVAPFILRGVSALGIDSVMAPAERRAQAWRDLAELLDAAAFEAMAGEVELDGVPEVAAAVLAGKIRGRTVVKVS